jgi:hypothetical protein
MQESNPTLSATQSGLQRKRRAFCPEIRKDVRIRKISSAKRTGENELLRIDGVDLLAFLWTAHAQSGFRDFNGRMQRDHKPTMWRKRLDLVKPLGKALPH